MPYSPRCAEVDDALPPITFFVLDPFKPKKSPIYRPKANWPGVTGFSTIGELDSSSLHTMGGVLCQQRDAELNPHQKRAPGGRELALSPSPPSSGPRITTWRR